MLTRPCDRCGAEAAVPLFDHLDYISGETFTILRCAQCGLVRTDFPYEAGELGRYYGPSYYGEQGRRFLSIMEWMVGVFRSARVRTIRQLHPTSGTVLDIGCGRGLMLVHLKEHGWSCSGTELSDELAAQLKQQHDIPIYTAPHLADNQLAAASFDVITLWHSLEHVERPAHTLDEVARLLKPGGIAIIEVPNLASWQAAIGQGAWFHLDAPRHLYHFLPDILREMLSERGLCPLRETTLSLEQGFYGMVQTLLNRVTSRPNILYSLLKKKHPNSQGKRLAGDVGLTLTLLLPALAAGTILEGLSVVFRRGAVIHVVAIKK